ncbi:MAG: 6-phosphofructokinase [Clostridia bacterium]
MKNLKGSLIFGQSGGPTAVINASAYGVFSQAFMQDNIIKVYGACHGIVGILNENFVDMSEEDPSELNLLLNTPSSALGSVRYKLADVEKDESDYLKLLEVFKKYDVRYFMYNGGNDSMDTCNKISKYLASKDYACNVIGVPKTIDNDLFGTDHCPGYGSAAKYIATTCMELALDSKVYDKGQIIVIEIMGRNAGWLTAASAIASYKGLGPDLIYVPEVNFNIDKFLDDVERVWNEKGNVIAAVSEGIHDENGKLIAEYGKSVEKDSFNHVQLGGVGVFLSGLIKTHMSKVKVRPIEFSLMQRCAAHVGSQTDIDEAYEAGQRAVEIAVNGGTDVMVGFKRSNKSGKYVCEMIEVPLSTVANTEKKLPKEYILNNSFISKKFMDYVMPLIQGEVKMRYEDGVPRFAQFKGKCNH